MQWRSFVCCWKGLSRASSGWQGLDGGIGGDDTVKRTDTFLGLARRAAAGMQREGIFCHDNAVADVERIGGTTIIYQIERTQSMPTLCIYSEF